MISLVTGSNGFIGSHLIETLLKNNHEVRCLVRKTSNLRWIKQLPVTFIYGDITHCDSLSHAINGIDFVFHLGGTLRARTEEEFMHINVQGTQNLIDTCLKYNSDILKFIFVSSQAAAGPSAGKRKLTETDPPAPISIYGKSKYHAELAVLNAKNQIPVTIIRPPSVYGPRDGDIFEMFQFVNRRIKPQLGFKSKYLSLIHVRDLVKGIYLASRSSVSDGEIYFMANEEIVTVLDFLKEIETAMHKKAMTIKIPAFAIDIYAQLSELIAHFNNSVALVNKDKAREMKQDFWLVDNAKAKQDLNFVPKISLAEGVRSTYIWYKGNGWL
ncbi:NAD-dependent epimerase/dehydratase family protein [candidate division KSB1 bacterium]|nr:NAD-dependent epimerase/dehydratase family protein [candidate division KSB1 bacterium]